MPGEAVLLLFLSAVLHTTWNFQLKQLREKYIAIWWSILIGSGIFLPFLIFFGLPAWKIWPYLLASVFVEICYFIALSAAYGDADFSLVYPIARGFAPALIATWSVLFLGEKLTWGGVLGVGTIILGLLIISVQNIFQVGIKKPSLIGLLLPILLAFLISIYSTIDGAAVKLTPVFSYTVLVFFLSPVLSTPLLLKKYPWQMIVEEFSKQRFQIISIGLLTVFAYFLALIAYSIAPVSYVGAIREVSVVLGALAGWKIFGEKMGGVRVIGSLVIFLGIMIIALKG